LIKTNRKLRHWEFPENDVREPHLEGKNAHMTQAQQTI
jgi:hypothetical protein